MSLGLAHEVKRQTEAALVAAGRMTELCLELERLTELEGCPRDAFCRVLGEINVTKLELVGCASAAWQARAALQELTAQARPAMHESLHRAGDHSLDANNDEEEMP